MKTPLGDIRLAPDDDTLLNAEDICKLLGLDNAMMKRLIDSGMELPVIYDAELKALFFTRKEALLVTEYARKESYNDKDRYLRLTEFKVFIANNF